MRRLFVVSLLLLCAVSAQGKPQKKSDDGPIDPEVKRSHPHDAAKWHKVTFLVDQDELREVKAIIARMTPENCDELDIKPNLPAQIDVQYVSKPKYPVPPIRINKPYTTLICPRGTATLAVAPGYQVFWGFRMDRDDYDQVVITLVRAPEQERVPDITAFRFQSSIG
jgi:hypothetical protein